VPDVTEWVWVRDLSTGYRYDIPAVWLDAEGRYPGVQVLAARPRHYGSTPRRTKFPTDLDTESSRTTTTTDATAPGADAAPAAATTEE
jgi:hypothetical protein